MEQPLNHLDPELIRGLEALVESTFPKRCKCCDRSFVDVADYVAQTEAIPGATRSLKQSFDDDGKVIVDLFRNCPCGSTLMDSFNDRRNATPQGDARRQRFNELMTNLSSRDLDVAIARQELLKTLRGEPSAILKKIQPPTAKK